MNDRQANYKTCVILPCLNEGVAIAKVISDFRSALPHATIYVIDNNSDDDTSQCAKEAGAVVISEVIRGKGNAIRRAFSEIDADIFVMADGDGTYDSSRAAEMIELLIQDNLDMIVAVRKEKTQTAYRFGHKFGNQLFNLLFRKFFGNQFTDIFSGYRVFSRRYIKSFPALSSGFEIETEMNTHAIQLNLPVAEIETEYQARSSGSLSKLRTLQDGFRIFLYIIYFLKQLRPFSLFFTIAIVFALVSILLGFPVIWTFIETGLVPRLPTAIAAASLMVIAVVSFATGLILDNIAVLQWEQKRLQYLSTEKFCNK